MKQKKAKISAAAALLLILLCLTAAAQKQSELNDPTLTRFQILDAKPSRVTLERLADGESLLTFVARQFPRAILVAETAADGGHQAVTFRVPQKGGVVDAILINYGTYLELHQDEIKLAPKDERKKEESSAVTTEQQLLSVTSTNPYANNCSGVTRSPGNPYPCCNTYYQNCTYFAWEQAYRFWGDPLPSAGNAKDWATNLSNQGYPVAPTSGVGLYNIGVSSTLSSFGHVAWTMEISNNMVLVWEQSCGSTQQGYSQMWRSIATFDRGFIQTKKALPSPYINGHSPQNLVSSSYNQQVVFWGGNINPGCRAVVTFPGGGRATLKDAQLQVGYGTLTATMLLGSSGWWSIQVFNENGKFTGMYSFYVW